MQPAAFCSIVRLRRICSSEVKRMDNRFSNLKCKEVVNVCDGCRLGYVCDVEVDTKNGQVLALIVPGPSKLLGLVGRHTDYVIPWRNVRQIGDDIILIDGEPDKFCLPRPKRVFF